MANVDLSEGMRATYRDESQEYEQWGLDTQNDDKERGFKKKIGQLRTASENMPLD